MKVNRFLVTLVILAISISIFVIPASAEEEHNHADIEIIFMDDNISDELKERATLYILSDKYENSEADDTATYSLLCNVIGHNIESTTTTIIKHKNRATAPKCLRQTITFHACTRCDFETASLDASTYIHCCA